MKNVKITRTFIAIEHARLTLSLPKFHDTITEAGEQPMANRTGWVWLLVVNAKDPYGNPLDCSLVPGFFVKLNDGDSGIWFLENGGSEAYRLLPEVHLAWFPYVEDIAFEVANKAIEDVDYTNYDMVDMISADDKVQRPITFTFTSSFIITDVADHRMLPGNLLSSSLDGGDYMRVIAVELMRTDEKNTQMSAELTKGWLIRQDGGSCKLKKCTGSVIGEQFIVAWLSADEDLALKAAFKILKKGPHHDR